MSYFQAANSLVQAAIYLGTTGSAMSIGVNTALHNPRVSEWPMTLRNWRLFVFNETIFLFYLLFFCFASGHRVWDCFANKIFIGEIFQIIYHLAVLCFI